MTLSRYAGGMTTGILLLLLTSCVNQKKATKWFDENRKAAAKYCAVKFPVIETVDTIYRVDSVAYEVVNKDLWAYADSLLQELEKKPHDKPINVDSLRQVIALQIRQKVKPCLDKIQVVEKTVLDTKQLEVANGVIEDLKKDLEGKDQTISKRDDRITILEEKIGKKNRLIWILIIIVIAETLWITKGIWIPWLGKLQNITKL